MNLGESIKYCRSIRKFSQKELAEKSNISKSYLCLIEKGDREVSIGVLQSISDALSIPVAIVVLIASESDDLVGDISSENIKKLNVLIKDLVNRAER